MNAINRLIAEGVFQIFLLCLPVLGAALLVGLIVAIFQATTSIQEQTLTFLPKFVAILTVIAFRGAFMLGSLSEYFKRILEAIPNAVK